MDLGRPGFLPVRLWAAAALGILLVIVWLAHITSSRLEIDATESVRMGVSLVHHGVMSLDECDEGCLGRGIFVRPQPGIFKPTNYREPVPVLVNALGVLIIDAACGPAEPEAYLEGPRARYLKYQNLLWLTLLSVGVFWAVHTLSGSFWFAWLAVALVNYQLLPGEFTINNLNTELPAMAILVPACVTLTLAFMRQKRGLLLLAGVLFGILTLIKAIVLYVFFAVVAALIALLLVRRPVLPWRKMCTGIGVLIVSFAVVLAPWLLRNQLELGTWQITQRGGESLWERALEDQMTPEEYRGAWYLWSPFASVHNWLGRKYHFSSKDLLRGGRLQRLDSDFSSPLSRADRDGPVMQARPDQAVTLFRQAQAQRMRLQLQFEAAGHPHPDIAAERVLYAQAKELIAAHPGRHLALTAVFMWRGGAKAFPVLLLALVLGLWRRRDDLTLFVLPAFVMTLLYAFFTPFFYRYGSLPRLIATLSVLVMIKWALDATRRSAPDPDPMLSRE